jgi:hypothetical protein
VIGVCVKKLSRTHAIFYFFKTFIILFFCFITISCYRTSSNNNNTQVRKAKRHARQTRLKNLEGKKPGKNDDDPADVLAIETAENTMGYYKLRASQEYEVRVCAVGVCVCVCVGGGGLLVRGVVSHPIPSSHSHPPS